ncbi:Gfo/Idh/MocA family oxidoreductase [Pseudomaricurvus alkylphenolicus]|uniref:Gfo/Idh/MocA family protein n=1 Tax=Pseudomaricurvus alkylphenolicus TaxID=1306991 RepID=UPI001423F748|nr:Gfo/Idh/MocA family oxidoreductase [Pseudomaricurvus alkylphenolicus]NIB38215.1 Gfo/Idh/MocA family oxidoreductase [Pseudomaricurvus alkylphenolicus]
MNTSRLKVVGLCFDHMHIGDQLALAMKSPAYQVVGVYDTRVERMNEVCDDIGVDPALRYDDWSTLLEDTQPDLAIVCSPTAEHALWSERLAERGVHILLEKPFAVSTTDAERAIEAARAGGVQLAINWPLAWYASHRTSKRLIDDGAIGEVIEVHYYDGNRGPQYHLHAKKEVEEPVNIQDSWWFKADAGGGSLLDYLGYGATLATWFRDGELPTEVQAVSHVPDGFEVDLQSVVVARYHSGLSTLQTRWGTFTDPWVTQPQPFCGFVIVGTEGTICSRDYAQSVSLQTREQPEVRDVPVDDFSHCEDVFALLEQVLAEGGDLQGPCGSNISLGGQRIVDAAAHSARERRPIAVANNEGDPS